MGNRRFPLTPSYLTSGKGLNSVWGRISPTTPLSPVVKRGKGLNSVWGRISPTTPLSPIVKRGMCLNSVVGG